MKFARYFGGLVLILGLVLAPLMAQARYLNPANGRFQTMDTYEGNTADPQSLHKYLYAHADPINGIDPSGHSLSEQLTVGFVFTFLASSLVFNIATETPTAAIDLYSGREFDEVAREVRNAVALGVAIDVATLGGQSCSRLQDSLPKSTATGKRGRSF